MSQRLALPTVLPSCWQLRWAAVTAAVASLAWGCYAHQGRPYRPGPQVLLKDATLACARLDERAARTLLERVVARHPETEEASRARQALRRSRACPLDIKEEGKPHAPENIRS